jgi:hypothetical protein
MIVRHGGYCYKKRINHVIGANVLTAQHITASAMCHHVNSTATSLKASVLSASARHSIEDITAQHQHRYQHRATGATVNSTAQHSTAVNTANSHRAITAQHKDAQHSTVQ